MRVLLVTSDFPPDHNGVGDYTRHLAEALAAAGDTVGVLTRKLDVSDDYAFTTHRIIEDWSRQSIAAAVDVCRQYDLVHVQYPGVACGRGMLLNRLPAAIGKQKSVVTLHEMQSMRTRWRLRASTLLMGLDAAVVVDEADALHVRRWSRLVRPIRPVSPVTIPIASNIAQVPVTPELRRDWRLELGIAPDETALLFFGILYPHKGIVPLLDATSLLRQEGRRVRTIVVGGFDRNADWRPPIEVRLRDEAIWINDADAERVSQLMHAADLAVLPYDSGAGPNRSSLLTALTHGVATVTTRGPSTPDDFGRRDDITFVPPGDAIAISTAVATLIDQPDVARDRADRARTHACTLTWSDVAAQHRTLYQGLLDGEKR